MKPVAFVHCTVAQQHYPDSAAVMEQERQTLNVSMLTLGMYPLVWIVVGTPHPVQRVWSARAWPCDLPLLQTVRDT